MNKFKGLIAIFAVAIIATGCASLVPSEKWRDCALAGALAGGVAGAMSDDDHDARNGVIGAVIGGVIGAALCSEESAEPVMQEKEKDTDGDGVVDSLDNCPNTPTGATVDSNGCALDTDGDGVADYKDQCPNTAAGATVDDLGCNRPLVLKGVTFGHNSAELTRAAKIVLNRISAIQKTYHADVSLEVAGHTNSLGSDAYNLGLSQRRAESVRAYMVSRGVEAGNISAKGYGEAEPVADNATKEGQATNRRVELRTK